MIIRKPYAFLIKNFKKIHIFMIILCAYIYYKTITLSSFVNEFLDLFTYDVYNEPISKYTGFFSVLFLLLIIASSIALMILLKHKNKPWKLYFLLAVEYTGLLIVFGLLTSFFNAYSGGLESTAIRALRDILFIFTLPQYAVFVILAIRILGVDLNKFDFKADAEYLELAEGDRDEVEISIDIDKNSIKRTIRKLKRNLGYVYKEHRFPINIALSILLIIIIYRSYVFIFVTNKAYKQGDLINTNGYTVKINNSYYSDKDYKGDKIEAGNSFVVLDVTIKNNVQKRSVNFNRFHVMNRTSNYSPTNKMYETEFMDLGTTIEDLTLSNGEERNLLLIYRVNEKEDVNRFVLYYQELQGNNKHLRKIKLKLNNLSKIKENEEIELGDVSTIQISSEEKELILDNLEISDKTKYSRKVCENDICLVKENIFTSSKGTKILKMEFSSNDFTGKDMIDFLTTYGKISYIDNSKTRKGLKIKNALDTYNYYGKYVYIKVPDDITTAKEIKLILTVRNNKYVYKLK